MQEERWEKQRNKWEKQRNKRGSARRKMGETGINGRNRNKKGSVPEER